MLPRGGFPHPYESPYHLLFLHPLMTCPSWVNDYSPGGLLLRNRTPNFPLDKWNHPTINYWQGWCIKHTKYWIDTRLSIRKKMWKYMLSSVWISVRHESFWELSILIIRVDKNNKFDRTWRNIYSRGKSRYKERLSWFILLPPELLTQAAVVSFERLFLIGDFIKDNNDSQL